jgi:serine/threonine protein phosphatase PrpC
LAAQIIQKHLFDLGSTIFTPPTISQSGEILKREIIKSGEEILKLQSKYGDENIDSTVSVGMVSETKDGNKRIMTIANVGDSRIYKYIPKTGEVVQLTKDQSLVQSMVDSGQITKEEAFSHPMRNYVLRTVGTLEKADQIDMVYSEIQEGDVFIAVSDGVSDNITPEGLPYAVRDEFSKSYDKNNGKIDLKKFSTGLAQRARNVMSTASPNAKKDDITVSVLRTPMFNK